MVMQARKLRATETGNCRGKMAGKTKAPVGWKQVLSVAPCQDFKTPLRSFERKKKEGEVVRSGDDKAASSGKQASVCVCVFVCVSVCCVYVYMSEGGICQDHPVFSSKHTF